MAMPKGRKNPNAGRIKGTPNRRTWELQDRAKALGVDPFEILLLFAKGDWQALGYEKEERLVSISDHGQIYEHVIPPALRQKSARDAAEYLYPKRKAVEVIGAEGENIFKTFAQIVAGVAESDDEPDHE